MMPLKYKNFEWFNKFITMGSKLSYALYLAHNMSHDLASFVLSPFTTNYIIIGSVGIIFSICISYLAYQYVEKYFLIIRDKYYPDKPQLKVI